jgi:hypothetical protein
MTKFRVGDKVTTRGITHVEKLVGYIIAISDSGHKITVNFLDWHKGHNGFFSHEQRKDLRDAVGLWITDKTNSIYHLSPSNLIKIGAKEVLSNDQRNSIDQLLDNLKNIK